MMVWFFAVNVVLILISTIKSSDNEILGNNMLVIGGLIAVAIFILAIGIFGLILVM